MTSRSLGFSALAVLSCSFALSGIPLKPVFADQAIINAIHSSTDKKMQIEELLTERTGKAFDKMGNDLKNAEIALQTEEFRVDREAAPIYEIMTSVSSVPQALSVTDQLVHDTMFNRHRELNRVPLVDIYKMGNGDTKKEQADYLVDSSTPGGVDTKAFIIFMRFFCDPESRGGTIRDTGFPINNFPYKGEDISFKLKCGAVEGADFTSRHSLLGTSDTSANALDVIGLPTRPEQLFFNPTTFPTAPTNTNATNTNPMAPIFYGAFAQALQFLVGTPPPVIQGSDGSQGDSSALLNQQGEISRQMLASYPFALLYAERAGSMGPSAAQAVATILRTKMGKAVQDEAMLARIDNLQRRKSISIAEYMDVVMYQLPMSPGYYERINQDLSNAQLRREVVWLTAMQTALNYQRNRWLEILATLEAVK